MPQIRGDHRDGVSEEIAKLAALRDSGILTEKEFQSQKKALLRANQSRLGLVGQSFLSPTRLLAIGAVIAVIVALAVIRPGTASPKTVKFQETSASSTQVQLAIAAAKTKLHTTYDDLDCLAFMKWAWSYAGITILPSASPASNSDPVNYWAVNPNHWVEHASPHAYNNPPAGAMMFWGANRWVSDGHVGMSLGNGTYISTAAYPEPAADDDVLIFNQSQRSPVTYNYLGWIMPGESASATPTPAPKAPLTSQPSSSGATAPSTAPPSATPTPGHTSTPTPVPSSAPSSQPTPPPSTPAPPPPPTTHAETAGGVAHTWTDYADAGGSEGPSVPALATVQISCKVTGFAVADGNTWWYRIASSPWNNTYFVSADAFYNNGSTSGPLTGTPFVDPTVPNC